MNMKKRIIIAVLSGYAIGAVTGAISVGCGGAIFAALLLAPLHIFISGGEFIWGIPAFALSGVAITQFVVLLVAGRLTGRPLLIVIGSFVLAALLAFLGGSTAAFIASL